MRLGGKVAGLVNGFLRRRSNPPAYAEQAALWIAARLWALAMTRLVGTISVVTRSRAP
jgi:hypothetical protein